MYNTHIQIFENFDQGGVKHIIFDSATYFPNVTEIENSWLLLWNVCIQMAYLVKSFVRSTVHVSILRVVSVYSDVHT